MTKESVQTAINKWDPCGVILYFPDEYTTIRKKDSDVYLVLPKTDSLYKKTNKGIINEDAYNADVNIICCFIAKKCGGDCSAEILTKILQANFCTAKSCDECDYHKRDECRQSLNQAVDQTFFLQRRKIQRFG